MARNKWRLYIILYAHSSPNKFHWAIALGPKRETPDDETKSGVKFHAVNIFASGEISQTWTMLEEDIVPGATQGLSVARIILGKIPKQDVDSVKSILRNAPVTNGDLKWRCRNWNHRGRASFT